MKHQRNVTPGIVVVSAFVITVVGSAQSRDKFTLKSANGIAFSEFKGYEGCQMIATSAAGSDRCGTSKVGCMKAILANPTIVAAYGHGIPDNGTLVPDGAGQDRMAEEQRR